MKRFARIRSELEASHPSSGRAQCSVGSIDDVGIRYGLTIHAFTPITIATAPTIVSTQSSTTRRRCERFGKNRSRGPRNGRLRDGRRELATDQGNGLEVAVGEMLEHDPFVAEPFDLLQVLDCLVDGSDRAALAIA